MGVSQVARREMEGFEARRAREAWALRRFGWSIEWMIRGEVDGGPVGEAFEDEV